MSDLTHLNFSTSDNSLSAHAGVFFATREAVAKKNCAFTVTNFYGA